MMRPIALLKRVVCLMLACAAQPLLAAECEVPALDAKAVTGDVQAALYHSIEAAELSLEIEPIGEIPAMTKPKVQLLGQSLRSRVAAHISGERCGGAYEVTQWFRVRAYRQAWVYGRNAKAGRPVSETELRRERVELLGAHLQPADLQLEPQGLWLAQDVRAGMPVLVRHLQAEPLVKRDELVRVVVQGQGLQVSVQGKAMRSGMLGDEVPVMLERGASSVPAVVAGKGEVHVGQ